MDATTDSEPFHKRAFRWLGLITIEPTMFFYMMAFAVTSVVEQAFFVHKACTVDHGLSEEACANLTQNETLHKEVQITVSKFHQINDVAGHIVPIILAFYMGNWSDRRGRKIPMVIGLISKFIYSSMIVVNAVQPTWNVKMIVYTATIPMAMLGADVAIFSACFSYISDISSVEQRTIRVTILDVVYLSTMPIGVQLGSYLFKNVVNKSYAIMFGINAGLLLLAIIYSCARLQWRTNSHQMPLSGTNIILDFFDKTHVTATFKTLTKSRPSSGRLHIWLLLIAMMLYVFQRDENPMSFLVTKLLFHWDVQEYSHFKTFKTALFVIAMLVGVPLLNKVFKLKDAAIIVIGASSHAAGRVIFAFAKIPELFYAGAAVSALGPAVAPILRSMISKLIPSEERGKIFSMLSVCDNSVPVLSGVLYSQLYNATISTAPTSIYWLTFATQISVILLILIIHFTTKKEKSSDDSDTSDTSITSNTHL